MPFTLIRWFPIHERARAVGISMAGFQLGNVLGLCLTPILMSLVGISGPFVLWSALGLLWTMVWIYGVANDPKQSPFVSKLELQLIQAGKTADSSHSNRKNLSQLLSHLLPKRPFWAIVFANFTNNWVGFHWMFKRKTGNWQWYWIGPKIYFFLHSWRIIDTIFVVDLSGIFCSSVVDAYLFQNCKHCCKLAIYWIL